MYRYIKNKQYDDKLSGQTKFIQIQCPVTL